MEERLTGYAPVSPSTQELNLPLDALKHADFSKSERKKRRKPEKAIQGRK